MVSGSQAEIRTVSLHGMGHAPGLHHPSDYGATDAIEIAAAMNPEWSNNVDDKNAMAAKC